MATQLPGQSSLLTFFRNSIVEGPAAAWSYATTGKQTLIQKAGLINQFYNQLTAAAVSINGTANILTLLGSYKSLTCAAEFPLDIFQHAWQGICNERTDKTTLIALAALNGARIAEILYCLETCDSQIDAPFNYVDIGNHVWNIITLASYALYQQDAPKLKKLY